MRITRIAGSALAAGTAVSATAPMALAAPGPTRGHRDHRRHASLAALRGRSDRGGLVHLAPTRPRHTRSAHRHSEAGHVHFRGRTENVFTGAPRVRRDADPDRYSVKGACVTRDDRRRKGHTDGRDDGRDDRHGGRRYRRRHHHKHHSARTTVIVVGKTRRTRRTRRTRKGAVRAGSGGSITPMNTAEFGSGGALATIALGAGIATMRRRKTSGRS